MLTLSPDLSVPLEAVTETFSFLGKRGRGKTTAAKTLAEEMIRAGVPVVVVDPVGVWWGLRASADGEGEGLPVVIFGGDHADLPLEETAGEAIADIVIEQRFPAVLDLSLLSKSAGRRFMADFAERLYHRNREALHLIIDEADLYAPQRVEPGQQRLLGAIDDMVRRGRARGLGLSLITQRPAVIHKDVLSQTEVLVCLGLTGSHDIAAVDEWVRLHADPDEARELKASLPSLPVGTAWFWSPGWLGILQRVQINRPTTFDSSRTPKPGESRIVPRQLAPVELAAIAEQLKVKPEEKIRDAGASGEDAALRRELIDLRRELRAAVASRRELIANVTASLERVIEELSGLCPDHEESGLAVADENTEEAPPAVTDESPASLAEEKPAANSAQPNSHRPWRQQHILNALATFEKMGFGAMSRDVIAVWSQQSPFSSAYSKNLTELKTAGLISYPFGRQLTLTRLGQSQALPESIIPTRAKLLDLWCRWLDEAEEKILRELAVAYPGSLDRETLADLVGRSITSSQFSKEITGLKKKGLATYPHQGSVAATSLICPGNLK